MTFPSPETIFIWRMNESDHAFGVMDYVNEGTVSLDRFESLTEVVGTAEDAQKAALERFPDYAVEVVRDAGVIARIDQLSAELRDLTFGEDETLNTLKLSL